MIPIFFDVETNGLHGSVVQFSAIFEKKLYNRYYFPMEDTYNQYSLNIHHLDAMTIKKKREESLHQYPHYFADDMGFVTNLFKHATILVAHNIKYDIQYIPQGIIKDNNCFCTMKTNIKRVKAKFKAGGTSFKYPTLQETAEYYGVQIDYDLHDASVDVDITRKIFIEMFQRGLIK